MQTGEMAALYLLPDYPSRSQPRLNMGMNSRADPRFAISYVSDQGL